MQLSIYLMLGNKRIEDVRWLCSLTESELDLLINLKKMIIRRASFIGHKSLAYKFDLKKLRDINFESMQVLKQQLGDIPQSCLDKSNLVKHEISEEFREMGMEELMMYIRPNRKKKIYKLFGIDDLATGKRNRILHGRTLLS